MQFPEAKFAKSNNVYKQFLHLRSELFEVQTEINTLRMIGEAKEKLSQAERVIEECFDIQHSAETLIRVIQREYPGIDVESIGRDVIRKNAERGYYD